MAATIGLRVRNLGFVLVEQNNHQNDLKEERIQRNAGNQPPSSINQYVFVDAMPEASTDLGGLGITLARRRVVGVLRFAKVCVSRSARA